MKSRFLHINTIDRIPNLRSSGGPQHYGRVLNLTSHPSNPAHLIEPLGYSVGKLPNPGGWGAGNE